jgi:phosphatidylserine decarboxylase
MLTTFSVMHTGWDMDPFVVVSFGKKVFRTRVIRHSLDPVWNEKLLFHVRRYETKFNMQFTVLDWDKLSSNDHIGNALLNVEELSKSVPQKDEQTGLYPAEEDGVGHMQEFSLPLATAKGMPWESKHNPTITFKCVTFLGWF